MKQEKNALQPPTGFTKIALFCGILSSLLYVAMNIICAGQYEGYSSASQTVSELSAIEAPSRPLWVQMSIAYALLLLVFAWGVLQAAGSNKKIRLIGVMLIVYTVIGLFWPPMHQRQVLAAGGGTMTDTLHIVFTFLTVPVMMFITAYGAATFGRAFRWYSIATISIQIIFGVLTGLDAPEMEANLPTPLIGVWERISIGASMLWIIVFAIIMLKRESTQHLTGIRLTPA